MRCLLRKSPQHKESSKVLHWTGIPLRSIPASGFIVGCSKRATRAPDKTTTIGAEQEIDHGEKRQERPNRR